MHTHSVSAPLSELTGKKEKHYLAPFIKYKVENSVIWIFFFSLAETKHSAIWKYLGSHLNSLTSVWCVHQEWLALWRCMSEGTTLHQKSWQCPPSDLEPTGSSSASLALASAVLATQEPLSPFSLKERE